LALGGNFSFDGINCEMLRISGQVMIDKHHLDIIDRMYVAAYKSGNDWVGALGQGKVELDLNWTEGDYSASGEIDVLGPPNTFVKFLTEADYHTNGTFSAMGEADLIVPHYIPVIGGKTLAQVDAAIRYKKDDLNNSEAAGWTKVNLLVKKITVGLEYNFGKKSLKKIGQSDVNNIESGVANDAYNAALYYYNFDVDRYVDAVTLHLKPKDPVIYRTFLGQIASSSFIPETWQAIILQTPDHNNTTVNLMEEISTAAYYYITGQNMRYPGAVVAPDMTVNLDSLTSNGISFHFQTNTVDMGEALPTGRYSFYCNWGPLLSIFDVELQQHHASPDTPFVELDLRDFNNVNIHTTSRIYVADTPTIGYYYNTVPDYNGAIFKTTGLPTEINEPVISTTGFSPQKDSITVFDTASAKWIKKPVSRNKQYYFYTVIRDGASRPVFSNIAGPVSMGTAVNVSVLPVKSEFVNNEAVVWLRPDMINEGTIDANSKISFYYDFDSMGYNGTSIPYMTDMSIKQVKSGNAVEFVVSSENDLRFHNGVYFYSEINTPSGELIRMPYMPQPLKVVPPLKVNVSYNGVQQGAAGVKVWLDGDDNGIFNGGPDIVLTTDKNGNVVFPYEWQSDITVGLILPGQLSITNPTAVLTKTIPAATPGSPQVINFLLNYPQLVVEGQIDIDLAIFGSGPMSNYVFADLNMNGSRESNEPAALLDGTNTFALTLNQPRFNLVYYDRNFNGSSQYRLYNAGWSDPTNNFSVNTQQVEVNSDKIYWIGIDQRLNPEDYDLQFNFFGTLLID
jgi:hypothetical protein